MATIEELQTEIQELKVVVRNLQDSTRGRHAADYNRAYNELRKAVLRTSTIQNVIENTYDRLGIADLLGDLILINNPYSDKLGFKFSRVIEEKVKEVLFSELPDDKDHNGRKNRFLRIIRKVIDNPIADVLLKTNPVGAVVSNIINTASNFIDTTWQKLETTKLGNGIKDFALITKDEISTEKLEVFKKSIKKYSDFYAEMLRISQQFDLRIDILKNSFDSMYLTYKNFNTRYLQILQIDTTDAFEGLDELFEKANANQDAFDHTAVLSKKRIVDALEFIGNLPNIEAEMERYSNEFAKTFHDFIVAYVEVLQTPIRQNWNAEEIDVDRLNEVIAKLNRFLSANVREREAAAPHRREAKAAPEAEALVAVQFRETADMTRYVA